MAEKRISMNAEAVRAILAGRKTQTRRPMKKQPVGVIGEPLSPYYTANDVCCDGADQVHIPPYQVGDRLWVREGVATNGPWNIPDECTLWYPADGGEQPRGYQRRSSIHMPKWAARIWLEVTGVRVERVQDISYEDALAEGLSDEDYCRCRPEDVIDRVRSCGNCAKPFWDWAIEFWREVWTPIYGNDSWHENPWVWVFEFRRCNG